jgi:hypothetical protein
MSQSKPTVAVLPSSAMADVVRKQLETAGIETATVETDGDFQLQVAEADFPRAMQLLFPMPGSGEAPKPPNSAPPPWKCPHCGEEVQPVSDVCWACGKPRTGAAPASAAPLEDRAASPGERETLRGGEPEASTSKRSSAAAAPNDPEANASGSPVNASGSPANVSGPPVDISGLPAHATTELRPAKPPARTRTPEPREPWDRWLIALWTLIVIAIGVIAWLALR